MSGSLPRTHPRINARPQTAARSFCRQVGSTLAMADGRKAIAATSAPCCSSHAVNIAALSAGGGGGAPWQLAAFGAIPCRASHDADHAMAEAAHSGVQTSMARLILMIALHSERTSLWPARPCVDLLIGSSQTINLVVQYSGLKSSTTSHHTSFAALLHRAQCPQRLLEDKPAIGTWSSLVRLAAWRWRHSRQEREEE